MNKIKISINTSIRWTACVLILLLSSCNLPSQEVGQSASVQIVQPVDGTRVALGAQVEIQSHITTPGSVRSITLMVNDQVDREDLFANPAFRSGMVYQPWTPNAPGVYSLQVALISADGQATSNLISIIVEEISTTTPTEVTSQTHTPTATTETPTETLVTSNTTATPGEIQATAKQDANCRQGPGIDYPTIWSFLAGQTVPVVGRDQSGTWLVVERLDGYGQCWVWRDLVTTQGNINGLPVIVPPPLPLTDTPTPTKTPTQTITPYTACHDYPDLATCNADPMGFGNCTWDTGLNRCQP